MNKQELIEHIKGLKNLFGNKVEYIEIDTVIELASKLDEPQKPAVPQFVADWYEENKDDFEGNLFRCINTISSMYEDEELNDFEHWVIEAHTEPFQTLVNMHQFGYEVEKEKRYTVRLKYTDDYLVKTNNGDYRFYNNIYTKSRKHTRKEIENARFGWMFDCEGIEVKEVE